MSFTFGATPQSQPQQSTSLFGGTGNQPSGGLFASTNQSQQQPQQQQPSQQSSGLFCSTSQPQQQQQSTGLFGSTNTQQQPQQPQQQQQQQQQQPGNPTGGLFGSTTGQTSSLFGSTAQKPSGQTTGGLFGSTARPAQQQTGSLFGGQQTQQPQQQQQQQQPGGLFGGGTGSLFGQSQLQNQGQQQPGGLFGSTSNQPATGGLFGSTTQPAQQNSLFGSTTQPQSQGGSGLFASTSQAGGQFGNASVSGGGSGFPRQEVDIESRMMAVKNGWDTTSPDCRFKYFFYNMVDPGTAGQYGRPAGANDDAKWAKAMRENPDPNSMVPVLATGWMDVKKRLEMQEKIASVHQQRVKELSAALSQLTRQTSLSSSIRLAALQAQLTSLMHRLIHLVAQTPQFIPVLQSTAFRSEEAAVKQALEGIKSDLDGKSKGGAKMLGSSSGSVGLRGGEAPSGTPRRGGGGGVEGRMIGQVNELWGAVEEIRKRRKGMAGGSEGWMGDERALKEVAEILSTQQIALQKLSELLNNAMFDADVMRQNLGSISR